MRTVNLRHGGDCMYVSIETAEAYNLSRTRKLQPDEPKRCYCTTISGHRGRAFITAACASTSDPFF